MGSGAGTGGTGKGVIHNSVCKGPGAPPCVMCPVFGYNLWITGTMSQVKP